MTGSRRRFLGAAGVAVATGLAGCFGTGTYSPVSVGVSEPFDAGETVVVPLIVDIDIELVNSQHFGIRGLTVELYDTEYSVLGRRELGDFSWEAADSSQRRVEDSVLHDETLYAAEWVRELSVEVDTVPEWITFGYDEIWQRHDAGRSDSSTTTRLPPDRYLDVHFNVVAYDSFRPPPPTIVPGDYEGIDYTRRETRQTGSHTVVPRGYRPWTPVDRFALSLDDETISSGEGTGATVEVVFADGLRTSWGDGYTIPDAFELSSTNETVATVTDDNSVVGRSPGTVTIEAQYQSETAGATLRVTADRGTVTE